MSDDNTCGYRFGPVAENVDAVCGKPADVVDRGDGTYLCREHAGAIREEQPERRFKQVDRTYDRLIAENLFGKRVCEKDSHEDCPASNTHMPLQEVPWFAERPEEADRVVERLREGGIDLRAGGIAPRLPGHWQYVFTNPENEPLAVCVAALSARGVEF
ncbi:hypothetical protein KJ059_15555 [Myxococcota bacterium]|nr:hypothetical protein [Myxococcota bacterium]MCZ7617601.1 hypothetical protein [Myxococcota bacterium]